MRFILIAIVFFLDILYFDRCIFINSASGLLGFIFGAFYVTLGLQRLESVIDVHSPIEVSIPRLQFSTAHAILLTFETYVAF